MKRGARVVVRDTVLTTLSALLVVLSVSTGHPAQHPAAATTSSAAGAEHRTMEMGPGPSSVLAVLASHSPQSHRVDPPSSDLPRVAVDTPCLSASPATRSAWDGPPRSLT